MLTARCTDAFLFWGHWVYVCSQSPKFCWSTYAWTFHVFLFLLHVRRWNSAFENQVIGTNRIGKAANGGGDMMDRWTFARGKIMDLQNTGGAFLDITTSLPSTLDSLARYLQEVGPHLTFRSLIALLYTRYHNPYLVVTPISTRQHRIPSSLYATLREV